MIKERYAKLRKCRETLDRLIRGEQEPIQHQSICSYCEQKGSSEISGARNPDISHWFTKYDELYKDGWTLTFVGCCHDMKISCECKYPISSCYTTACSTSSCNCNTDMHHKLSLTSRQNGHEDTLDDVTAFTTRFNVTALVPSLQRAYVDLWDTIELSFLGYYDAENDTRFRNLHPVPSIMRAVRTTVRTSVLPELAEYLYFMVGFKPLARGGLISGRRGRDRGVMGPILMRNTSTTCAYVNTSTTIEEIDRLRNTANTMSAWKLASILRERGVRVLCCSICDCIDLVGDDDEDVTDNNEERLDGERGSYRGGSRSPFLREFQKRIGGSQAWITPCQCQELVHRQCLERKLKLIPKYEPWERLKLIGADFWRIGLRVQNILCHPFSKENGHSAQFAQGDPLLSISVRQRTTNHEHAAAPRVWISYDSTMPVRNRPRGNEVEQENATIAVDDLGQFTSLDASCKTCGGRYLRSVRLPRSKAEVIAASLSDPLSVVRALSTLIHFLFTCAFLAACEGMCPEETCKSHRTLLTTPCGVLKWPTTGLNGLALAMWQLQQCCMLHIFFSRRFAAIIDRLWMGPISLFYCRLYFYFVVTSLILTVSFIPVVSRNLRYHILEPLMGSWLLEILQPVGDAIALANLFQYAIGSTTVICIFWRTQYRIFTVANGKEAAANLRRWQDSTRHLPHHAAIGMLGARRAGGGVAANNNPPVPLIQRIDGVGPGDINAASHPMYHGPW